MQAKKSKNETNLVLNGEKYIASSELEVKNEEKVKEV